MTGSDLIFRVERLGEIFQNIELCFTDNLFKSSKEKLATSLLDATLHTDSVLKVRQDALHHVTSKGFNCVFTDT